jgi:hypothetical protein
MENKIQHRETAESSFSLMALSRYEIMMIAGFLGSPVDVYNLARCNKQLFHMLISIKDEERNVFWRNLDCLWTLKVKSPLRWSAADTENAAPIWMTKHLGSTAKSTTEVEDSLACMDRIFEQYKEDWTDSLSFCLNLSMLESIKSKRQDFNYRAYTGESMMPNTHFLIFNTSVLKRLPLHVRDLRIHLTHRMMTHCADDELANLLEISFSFEIPAHLKKIVLTTDSFGKNKLHRIPLIGLDERLIPWFRLADDSQLKEVVLDGFDWFNACHPTHWKYPGIKVVKIVQLKRSTFRSVPDSIAVIKEKFPNAKIYVATALYDYKPSRKMWKCYDIKRPTIFQQIQ